MPKSSKSSASSATRKKHAKNAAGPSSDIQISKPSKKDIKKGLVPPHKKSYIAPSKLKPSPVQVDPLDNLGLAATLPADLVVILRRLAKKDGVTKIRALEELDEWVSRFREGGKDTGMVSEEANVDMDVLMAAFPVWLYRYPALSLHSSRRIRHLSAQLHASLLNISILRSALLTFLRETGSETQVSQLLGSWCLSAWDVDQSVSTLGSRCWKGAVDTGSPDNQFSLEPVDKRLILDDSTLARSVLPFILATVMDPLSTYISLNPSHLTTPEELDHIGRRYGVLTPAVTPSGSGGKKVHSTVVPSTITSRGEEDSESADDRNARLRVGALGALKWIFDTYFPTESLVLPLRSLLSSPKFWSILHHAAHPPFLSYTTAGVFDGFGAGQTIVRRAGWNVVQTLMGVHGVTWKEHLFETESAGVLSTAILRSAFVEPDALVRSSMWEPLLMYLTKVRDAWIANLKFEHTNSADLEDGSSDSPRPKDATIPSAQRADSSVGSISSFTSTAYSEFLAFLTLGCNRSPVHGYPTILVILSTIPNEILSLNLSALSEFFEAFWAAIDGQAFSTLFTERENGMDAFLGAWGECLLWLSGKLMKNRDGILTTSSTIRQDCDSREVDLRQKSLESTAHMLVEVQFDKLVAELRRGLRADPSVTGGRIAAVIEKLETSSPDLFEQAWVRLSSFATATITNDDNSTRREYAISFLAVLNQRLPYERSSRHEVERLVCRMATDVITRLMPISSWGVEHVVSESFKKNGEILEKFLGRFGSVLEMNEDFVKFINELFSTNTPIILLPSLVLSHLTHWSDPVQKATIWHIILSALGASSDIDLNTRLNLFDMLLEFSKTVGPTSWTKPQEGELDGFAKDLLNQALNGDLIMLRLIEKLLKVSDAFVDVVTAQHMVSTILTTAIAQIQSLTRDPSTPLTMLSLSLKLLFVLEKEKMALLQSVPAPDVMPWVFVLAFALPQCSPSEEELSVINLSKSVWETWRESADHKACKTVYEKIKDISGALVFNTDVRLKPTFLLQALSQANLQVEAPAFSDTFPKQSDLDSLLSSVSTDPIDSALAIVQRLTPPCSTHTVNKPFRSRNFDKSGFSPYARGASCLLHLMVSERQVAREHMWAMRHVLILALFVTEALQIPAAISPVFGSNPKATESELREISRQAQNLVAFLLVSPDEERWHETIVGALVGNPYSALSLDPVGAFIKLLFEASIVNGTIRDSLVLHTALEHVLRSATRDDADLWIDLARNLQEKALQTSLAVSLAITEFAPNSPKLDRYRNELASKLTSVPPSKANTTGFRLLRLLSVIAPSPDSDVIFLPQQRAVYLVQALQSWMASDVDLDDGVEWEITLLLCHLAPIVQNVQGAHWEFVMDMIESNIENSSLKGGDTLVLLSRSLELFTTVQDLSVSNKYLRDLWTERSQAILTMVRDLLAVKTGTSLPSLPLEMCRKQALSAVRDIPSSLMDETTLSTMCHLLIDPSVDIQTLAHQFLQKAAVTRTEYLTIEAGIDFDAVVIELPPELVIILQSGVKYEVDTVRVDMEHLDPFGYLLGWMILFDLFTGASLKVKIAYVDHMRKLSIMENYFLPNIFEILGIGNETWRQFKLDAWCVEEYWITFYDATAPQSITLLAAHLYYRALLTVPSLIKAWWDGLKDRQLLTAVTAFTSSYFSPVLIKSELILVKPSSGNEEDFLTDESFNVKVAHVIHEVTATFNVDDQRMEIGIKLPAEYPLRAVEIRDIRRIGVPEKLWRKWLFAMQQVVTSQNGRIVDALSLFKKNVSLHFEGQVECAICYSIISVTDRSLPTKPCKTCKNRFHSSCLYKWFNTSHSSSCPLCRSDIM